MDNLKSFSNIFSYGKIIVPTGSSYLLDEFYQGEEVQIGGTLRNTIRQIDSNFYIKCQNDAGEIKFVSLLLDDNDLKIVIRTHLNNCEVDVLSSEVKFIDFDISITVVPFYKELASMENSDIMFTLTYHNGNYNLLNLDHALNILKDLPVQIEVIDNLKPKYNHVNSIVNQF